MRPPTFPLSPFTSLVHGLRSWPQTSQEQARRNAMLAATACTQRRVERQEVEDYFATRVAPREHDSAQLHAR